MDIQAPYTEDLASPRTEALFLGLAGLSAALAGWRTLVNFLEYPRLVVLLRQRLQALTTRAATVGGAP